MLASKSVLDKNYTVHYCASSNVDQLSPHQAKMHFFLAWEGTKILLRINRSMPYKCGGS